MADGIQGVKEPCPDGHEEVEAYCSNILPLPTALRESRATSAKYLDVELTGDLPWGQHVQATAAKAIRTSAFVSRNSKDARHRCSRAATKDWFVQCWSVHLSCGNQQYLIKQLKLSNAAPLREECSMIVVKPPAPQNSSTG